MFLQHFTHSQIMVRLGCVMVTLKSTKLFNHRWQRIHWWCHNSFVYPSKEECYKSDAAYCEERMIPQWWKERDLQNKKKTPKIFWSANILWLYLMLFKKLCFRLVKSIIPWWLEPNYLLVRSIYLFTFCVSGSINQFQAPVAVQTDTTMRIT